MTTTQPDLNALFRFTDSDLAANRNGTLSPEQEERTRRNRQLTAMMNIVVAAAIAIGVVVILNAPTDPSAAIIRNIVILVGIPLILFPLWRAWVIAKAPITIHSESGKLFALTESDAAKTMRAVGAGIDILSAVSGNGTTSGRDRRTEYKLGIGMKEFNVSKKTHEALLLSSGGQYKFYYVELPALNGKQTIVLSVEPITGAAATKIAY